MVESVSIHCAISVQAHVTEGGPNTGWVYTGNMSNMS